MWIVIYADKSMEQYDDSITLDTLAKLIDHDSELLSITHVQRTVKV